MRLHIDNKTPYMNDYYFQTLCLLYFPGEKFPTSGDNSQNAASFHLEEQSFGDTFFYRAKVVLTVGARSESGEFSSRDYQPVIEHTDETIAMITVGKAFLTAGEKLFGFSLPWGHITGLRPVKRAKYYLDKKVSAETLAAHFINDYHVSAEKTDLSIRTATLQSRIIDSLADDFCSLYVSIPFCPTRCSYCSFVSYSNKKLFDLIPAYLTKLKDHLTQTAQIIKASNLSLGAIYVGGGTPTILDTGQIGDLLSHIGNSFDLSKLREYTYEAGRPDTVNKEKLKTIISHGVDRISINTQTTDDKVLHNIGRKHTVQDFYSAVNAASRLGFKCINSDIIVGLPGDTVAGFDKTLSDIIDLGFQNITVHSLSIKNSAQLRQNPESLYDPRGESARKSVSDAYNVLTGKGYEPYYLYRQKSTVGSAENTGYSLPGYENIYNIVMMEEHSTVFATGAGAITKLVSKDREVIERIAYPKYPFEYLDKDSGTNPEQVYKFFSKHH